MGVKTITPRETLIRRQVMNERKRQAMLKAAAKALIAVRQSIKLVDKLSVEGFA